VASFRYSSAVCQCPSALLDGCDSKALRPQMTVFTPRFSALRAIGARISCNYSRNGVNKPPYIFIF
jgi:hypothetical protein